MDEQKTTAGSGAKLCTNCGEMLQLTVERVPLRGAYGFWNDAEMDAYTCPNCGKIEFYRAQVQPYEPDLNPGELVTCPTCGAQHSKHINCPNCMMDGGLSQLERNIGQQKKREKQEKERKKKDPWDWK